MRLRADKLLVYYQEDNEQEGSRLAQPAGGDQAIQRIEAMGNVFVTRPGETAKGDNGTYQPATGDVTLEGNVVLDPRAERDPRRPPALQPAHRPVDGLCRGTGLRRQAGAAGPSPVQAREPAAAAGPEAVTVSLDRDLMPPGIAPQLVARPERFLPPPGPGRARRLQSGQALSHPARPPGRVAAPCPRRGRGPARAQRGRQDHLLLHHHRPDRGRPRPGRAGRPGHHPPAHAPPGQGRHRLPAAGGLGVPRPHGRAEHPGRARAARARPRAAPCPLRAAPARVRPRPRPLDAGHRPFRRRAAADRDRPRPGLGPELRPPRRAAWPASTPST